jgi:hypothetical protein
LRTCELLWRLARVGVVGDRRRCRTLSVKASGWYGTASSPGSMVRTTVAGELSSLVRIERCEFPICPHCGLGIGPDDLWNGILAMTTTTPHRAARASPLQPRSREPVEDVKGGVIRVRKQTCSESLFVEDVTVDAPVLPPYLLRLVAGVVSKRFYESELAVERTQVVALEIDV